MNFCIILSHLNSAGNPLLYAYHLKDFRAALKNFMWNLLFPHNNMKSSVVSVIHERGSLVDSQRQYHRQIGGLSSSKRPTSSLLRQVTDVRSKGLSVSRDISIRDKETGNASSSSQSDKQEDDNMSQNSNEFQRNESDKFENNRIDSNISKSSSHITSMELQTYKPLMPLLPAEIDNVEETPPASIFVIEVDVNHMESVHKKVNEELTENKDKG